jgi:hypothetical protein
MTTAIETIRPHGIRSHKHGLTAVLVGAVLAVGVVATTAVVTADDDSTPAPPAATQPASSAEDPLVSRFGQPPNLSTLDFREPPQLRFSGPR